MAETSLIRRTHSGDTGFRELIGMLDRELWDELNEDQATYDQHNKVPDLETVLVAEVNAKPVACGCFKRFAEKSIEVKRMYVVKSERGKGWSKKILYGLEDWARELGYQSAVLETSIHFATARSLYEKAGYRIIPNYGPYVGLPESICFGKNL